MATVLPMFRYKTDYIFMLFILLQVAFWGASQSIKPRMIIVPEVPREVAVKALSLGDKQFYFRSLAFEIQNAGDTFGRFTALKEYDYEKVSGWFYLLDKLDTKSNFVPALASYYYSQTQNVEDVRYIIDYLAAHTRSDPEKKWWWLGQAVYLANHKLKDKKLALKLAYELAAIPGNDRPLWTKQMPAFIHAKVGEYDQALIIIKDLMDNEEDLSQGEINFMNYFIKERLQTITGVNAQ